MMNNILFICLGNICRSPLAEGFLRHHVELNRLGDQFQVDSAGTGNWHVGNPPDSRAVRAAAELGVDIAGLRARQIHTRDFDRFDHVIAMDQDNLRDLQYLGNEFTGDFKLDLLANMLEDPGFVDVPDPWYGNYHDFQAVAQQLDSACCALLEKLLQDGR